MRRDILARSAGLTSRVIKAVGSRVEQEHSKHLRDVRRIEQQTASFANNLANVNPFAANGNDDGEVDFESLVKGRNGTPNPFAATTSDPWDVDGWATNDDGDNGLVSGLLDLPMVLADCLVSEFPIDDHYS